MRKQLIFLAIWILLPLAHVAEANETAATREATANWTLDNSRSSLTFVSIKAGDVGEVHRFTQLNGEVEPSGAVTVVINLASVDTLIPIRDERMREILFEVVDFPTATLTANVDYAAVSQLKPGQTMATSLTGELTVKGQTTGVAAQVTIARLSSSETLVIANQPIVLTAASVGLTEGIEKLREIAGLPSISQAVPVTFTLLFTSE